MWQPNLTQQIALCIVVSHIYLLTFVWRMHFNSKNVQLPRYFDNVAGGIGGLFGATVVQLIMWH
jgi:hypothetical protein